MLEIAQGVEVRIPKDLSLNSLPKSYHYYDSIIAIVQENTNPLIKGKFQERIASAYEYYSHNDPMMRLRIDLAS